MSDLNVLLQFFPCFHLKFTLVAFQFVQVLFVFYQVMTLFSFESTDGTKVIWKVMPSKFIRSSDLKCTQVTSCHNQFTVSGFLVSFQNICVRGLEFTKVAFQIRFCFMLCFYVHSKICGRIVNIIALRAHKLCRYFFCHIGVFSSAGSWRLVDGWQKFMPPLLNQM